MSSEGLYTEQLIHDLGLVLAVCLQDVVQIKPLDPIDFMAKWLYKYMDNNLYFEKQEQYYKTARASVQMARSRKRESKGQIHIYNTQLLRLKAYQKRISEEAERTHSLFGVTQRDFQIQPSDFDISMSLPSVGISSISSDQQISSLSEDLLPKHGHVPRGEQLEVKRSIHFSKSGSAEPITYIQNVGAQGERGVSRKYAQAISQRRHLRSRAPRFGDAVRKPIDRGVDIGMSDLYDRLLVDYFGSEMSSEREDANERQSTRISDISETERISTLRFLQDTRKEEKIFEEGGMEMPMIRFDMSPSRVEEKRKKDRFAKLKRKREHTYGKADEEENEILFSDYTESTSEDEEYWDSDEGLDGRTEVGTKKRISVDSPYLMKQNKQDMARLKESSKLSKDNFEKREPVKTIEGKIYSTTKKDKDFLSAKKQTEKTKTGDTTSDSYEMSDVGEEYGETEDRLKKQSHDDWADLLKGPETDDAKGFEYIEVTSEKRKSSAKKVIFKENTYEIRTSSEMSEGTQSDQDSDKSDVSWSDVSQEKELENGGKESSEKSYKKITKRAGDEESEKLRTRVFHRKLKEYDDKKKHIDTKQPIGRKLYRKKKQRKRGGSISPVSSEELDYDEYRKEKVEKIPPLNLEETPLWDNLRDSRDDDRFQRYDRLHSPSEHSLEEVLKQLFRKSYESPGIVSTGTTAEGNTEDDRDKAFTSSTREAKVRRPSKTRDEEVLSMKQTKRPRTGSVKREWHGKRRFSQTSQSSSKRSSVSDGYGRGGSSSRTSGSLDIQRGHSARSSLMDKFEESEEISLLSADITSDEPKARKRLKQLRKRHIKDEEVKSREEVRRHSIRSLTDADLDEDKIRSLKKPTYSDGFKEMWRNLEDKSLDEDPLTQRTNGYQGKERFKTQKAGSTRVTPKDKFDNGGMQRLYRDDDKGLDEDLYDKRRDKEVFRARVKEENYEEERRIGYRDDNKDDKQRKYSKGSEDNVLVDEYPKDIKDNFLDQEYLLYHTSTKYEDKQDQENLKEFYREEGTLDLKKKEVQDKKGKQRDLYPLYSKGSEDKVLVDEYPKDIKDNLLDQEYPLYHTSPKYEDKQDQENLKEFYREEGTLDLKKKEVQDEKGKQRDIYPKDRKKYTKPPIELPQKQILQREGKETLKHRHLLDRETWDSQNQIDKSYSLDRDVNDGDKQRPQQTKSKTKPISTSKSKIEKLSSKESFKTLKSVKTSVPAFGVWYFSKSQGVMVCAHPVLGELRSPQRPQLQFHNIWDQNDVSCESLYDAELYVVCDLHFDDEEYVSRMLEWTGTTWMIPKLGSEASDNDHGQNR